VSRLIESNEVLQLGLDCSSVADMHVLCDADVQANEMVTGSSCRRLL
jgi:hypothetical protein